ncbi:phage tail protein [Pseudoalteromonas viridis]|uniref:Tail fiber protein n=1 Tax=Pseudoalteromonas viridis TaxID=339617 RepID=A0ABX7V3Q4_9GAMM|nr:tail fiber protein [Pseudoalteromonas viridis]QTL33860.1 tail fiber protein [Pseudoalteromonas viridis]
MSSDSFTGELMPFLGNFVVRGYLACEGQLLDIAKYSTLYSLIGTFYGGDGRVSFAVPDLRGRRLTGRGKAPDLKYDYKIGQKGGADSITLTEYALPMHNHAASLEVPNTYSQAVAPMAVADNAANTRIPNTKVYLGRPQYKNYVVPNDSDPVVPIGLRGVSVDVHSTASADVAIQRTGQNIPIDFQTPYNTVNWLICTDNLYPERG